MHLLSPRWAYQIHLRILAPAIIYIAQAVLPQSALAQSCPENTYEISRQETADNIRLRCACAPGTKHIKGRCKEYIPRAVLKNGMPFVVAEVKGKVKAYITSGSEKYKVSSKHALVVNHIVTGDDSHIVLQLPSGKRIAIGPNTTITFKNPGDDYDLDISQVLGLIRFDQPGKTEEIRRLAQRAFARSKLWTEKQMYRRFKVRTSGATVAVRGTDFFIEGTGSGAQIIRVIDGEVDIFPHSKDSPNTVLLKAGQQAQIEKDGRVSRLTDTQPGSLLNLWVDKTGLSDLPSFQSK